MKDVKLSRTAEYADHLLKSSVSRADHYLSGRVGTYPLIRSSSLLINEAHHIHPIINVRVVFLWRHKLASVQVTKYSLRNNSVDKEYLGHLLIYSLEVALVEILPYRPGSCCGW